MDCLHGRYIKGDECMKRKVLFGSLTLLSLLIAICVYFAHPKYAFTARRVGYRGNYTFSFYGSHTMVVTYGFKKPHEMGKLRTIAGEEIAEYQYEANFKQDIIAKIGIKQLSKKQYNEFVELFSEAGRRQPRYVHYGEVLKGRKMKCSYYELLGPEWEAVFKTQTGIANTYFLWDTVLGGEPTYVEIAKKAADISPAPIEDRCGNSIRMTSYDDPNYIQSWAGDFENWKLADWITLRIWPRHFGINPEIMAEERGFLGYLLWERFPPDESDYKYAF